MGALEERLFFENSDIYISYLPLAHVMEIAVLLGFLFNKGKIGFYHGNMLKLKEDL
jgi:long-subunit acyl-CoA synthetase (AMP-forming)